MKDVKERLLLKSAGLKNIYNEASMKIRDTEAFLQKAQIFIEAEVSTEGLPILAWKPTRHNWRIMLKDYNAIGDDVSSIWVPLIQSKIERRLEMVPVIDKLLIEIDKALDIRSQDISSK